VADWQEVLAERRGWRGGRNYLSSGSGARVENEEPALENKGTRKWGRETSVPDTQKSKGEGKEMKGRGAEISLLKTTIGIGS